MRGRVRPLRIVSRVPSRRSDDVPGRELAGVGRASPGLAQSSGGGPPRYGRMPRAVFESSRSDLRQYEPPSSGISRAVLAVRQRPRATCLDVVAAGLSSAQLLAHEYVDLLIPHLTVEGPRGLVGREDAKTQPIAPPRTKMCLDCT